MNPVRREQKELDISGVAVSPGIVIGKAFVLYGDTVKVEPKGIRADAVQEEVDKFVMALERTREELQGFKNEAAQRLGDKDAAIFEVHQMLLQDETVRDEIITRIREEKRNADHIVAETIAKYEAAFDGAADEYFRARAADLRDIKWRVIRHIQGEEAFKLESLTEPVILIARDLTPSDTIKLDRSKVLGFATELGSRTSHAAILARSLKVPSVVGLIDACQISISGNTVVLDGNAGILIVNPSSDTVARYRKLQREFNRFENNLSRIRSLPARTKDGKEIELSANIEFFDEVKSVQDAGARGVGLYRTEYLYLMGDGLPTEQQQIEEYSRILKALRGNPLTLRTFDIGGDKAQKFFAIQHEANPFLGFRGVRLYQRNEPVFLTQVRAILTASVHGPVRIMFPMIATVEELRYCKSIVEHAKKQLTDEGVAYFPDIPIGAMIEVPSAAITTDLIAKECDFLSIGTNDLIQYTMAVDRGNKTVAYLYRNFDPAILRFIGNIIRQGHEQGVWVGMCGEMASDALATMMLIGLGLDEFSVSPVSLLVIKEIIRQVEFDECQNLATAAMTYDTPQAVESYIRDVMHKKFKHLMFSDTGLS
jgi:phosphoenolpyruvate-protein phosphotransferase (PTS system enzyme I)